MVARKFKESTIVQYSVATAVDILLVGGGAGGNSSQVRNVSINMEDFLEFANVYLLFVHVVLFMFINMQGFLEFANVYLLFVHVFV